MKITINVPEASCSRCKATSPVLPQMLRHCPDGAPPGTPSTVDSSGATWIAVMSENPAGWAIVDENKTLLCAPCVEAWKKSSQSFIDGTAPTAVAAPVVNIAPTAKIEIAVPTRVAAAPVMAPQSWSQPAPIPQRAQTMSVIVPAKVATVAISSIPQQTQQRTFAPVSNASVRGIPASAPPATKMAPYVPLMTVPNGPNGTSSAPIAPVIGAPLMASITAGIAGGGPTAAAPTPEQLAAWTKRTSAPGAPTAPGKGAPVTHSIED